MTPLHVILSQGTIPKLTSMRRNLQELTSLVIQQSPFKSELRARYISSRLSINTPKMCSMIFRHKHCNPSTISKAYSTMAQIAPDVTPTSIQRTETSTQQVTQTTVQGLGNLIKLLPSGTFFLFITLNPAFTNNGECRTSNKYLTAIFLSLCVLASCFSWFTDSYIDKNGKVQYGIVTRKGLYPLTDSDSSAVNLSAYKRSLGDFVHAFLSVIVFMLLALLDRNTIECFYPSFNSSQKQLIMALPPVVGAIASSAFVLFPNKRHGIGFPPRQASEQS